MKKISLKTALIIFISVAFPYLLSGILHLEPLFESTTIYMVIWIMFNYLFLSTMSELFPKYIEILSLKDLKISKMPYILKFLVYIVFLIFINLYMIQILFVRDNDVINSIVSMPGLIIILLVFTLSLLSGAFPEVKDEENASVFSVSNKNSFKLGRDKFGTVAGLYDKGLIMGDAYINFDQIYSIYINKKNNALMIKAKDENKNKIINIDADRTKAKMIELIKYACDNNLLEKKVVNLK